VVLAVEGAAFNVEAILLSAKKIINRRRLADLAVKFWLILKINFLT
jgi:hypothetical protein